MLFLFNQAGQALHYKMFFLLALMAPIYNFSSYPYSSVLNNAMGQCPKASHTLTKTSSIFPSSRTKNLIFPFASHTHSGGHSLLIPHTASQPFLILLSGTERTILSAQYLLLYIVLLLGLIKTPTAFLHFVHSNQSRPLCTTACSVNYYHTPLTLCHLPVLCGIIVSLLSHLLLIV